MRLMSDLLVGQKVIPVVVIDNQASALNLAQALLDGGVNVIEITLRNEYGLHAIEIIKRTFPQMVVLAGTVNHAESMQKVVAAGVDGVISPGLTPELLAAARALTIPYMPGVATGSEILLAMQYGLQECKLFPASVVGGVPALKAFGGPFPAMRFCPTGGVDLSNYAEYLALPNVMCVGGSWLAPSRLINRGDWAAITQLCVAAAN